MYLILVMLGYVVVVALILSFFAAAQKVSKDDE
jgi:uncharacterized membrane protein